MIVRLTWTEGAPSQQGDGFRVYRSVNGGTYTLKQTLPLSQTTYDDSDVSYGNYYRYKVVEYKGGTESDPALICVGLLQQTASSTVTDALSKRPCRKPAETCALGDWREPFALVRALAQPVPVQTQEERLTSRTLPQEIAASADTERALGRPLWDWLIPEDGDRLVLARELGESLSLSSFFDRVGSFTRETYEELVLETSTNRSLISEPRESVSIVSGAGRGLNRAVPDWVGTAHAANLITGIARSLHADAVLSHSLWRGLALAAILEETTLGDAVAHGLTRVLLEGLSAVAEQIEDRAIVRLSTEQTSISESWERVAELARAFLETTVPTASPDSRSLTRSLLEPTCPTAVLLRRLQHTLLAGLGASDTADRHLQRTPCELLAITEALSRLPLTVLSEAVSVWARPAVPARSTPYPWDTGQGGLFLERLARALLFSVLERQLSTARTARTLAFLQLARELLTKRFKRSATLSKPLS